MCAIGRVCMCLRGGGGKGVQHTTYFTCERVEMWLLVCQKANEVGM